MPVSRVTGAWSWKAAFPRYVIDARIPGQEDRSVSTTPLPFPMAPKLGWQIYKE